MSYADEQGTMMMDTGEALAGKYLTFFLDQETFGLEILKVQEIIGIQEITKIPRTPPYVKGVINLRGKVIPVVDLRLKFGLEEQAFSRKTCIIMVQVKRGETYLIMGIIVDEVSEVIDIPGEQIEKTPALGSQVNSGFILGMAKIESSVKILLDIDMILSAEEMEVLARNV